MFTQIRGPNHHFSAFYEDNSLLIQFMVVEFVQTYELIIQVKTLIQERLDVIQTSETVFSSLIQVLGQLVGCFPQQDRSSFCRWKKGSLTKFKEYCEQFSRNSSYQDKQHIHLHMAAHQAWLTALHNLELLTSLNVNSYTQNSEAIFLLLPLKRTFNTLQLRLNQVIRCLPRIMSSYWNNENVVLCLLRKRIQLAEIYGSDFLHKRFKWPVKAKELNHLLVTRYQTRGFENLLPVIQQVMDAEEGRNENS